MREPRERASAYTAVGVVLGLIGIVTLLVGREAVSAYASAVFAVAYWELRRIFVPRGHAVTLVVGAGGVGGFLWVGYDGRLAAIAWVAAALVLVLLTALVVVHEVGSGAALTEEAAATFAAAGIVGVLGAHVLLTRAVPRFGFRGLLVLGLMVLLNDTSAFFGGRAFGRRLVAPRLSPRKTWEGVLCGLGASLVVGVVAGLALDPPFDPRSGVVLGAGIGVVAPIGDLVFSALKRSAGVKASGRVFGPLGGALDTVDGLLFAAPAFYWAFRTLAL